MAVDPDRVDGTTDPDLCPGCPRSARATLRAHGRYGQDLVWTSCAMCYAGGGSIVRGAVSIDGRADRHLHAGLREELVRQWPERAFPSEMDFDAYCDAASTRMVSSPPHCLDLDPFRAIAVKAFNPDVPLIDVKALLRELDGASRRERADEFASPWQSWDALTALAAAARTRGAADG
jgi:hypothetical protein